MVSADEHAVRALVRVRRDLSALLRLGGTIKGEQFRGALKAAERHLDVLDPSGEIRAAVLAADVEEYNVTLRRCAKDRADAA